LLAHVRGDFEAAAELLFDFSCVLMNFITPSSDAYTWQSM
jgi:hypothetical protein